MCFNCAQCIVHNEPKCFLLVNEKDCKKAMCFIECFAKIVKLKKVPMISHTHQSYQPKSFAAFVMAQTLTGGAITERPQPCPSIKPRRFLHLTLPCIT